MAQANALQIEENDDDISASSLKTSAVYGAHMIKKLKGLEAVRKRPGMYIGDKKTRGLHHCVWEIVDNSVDEAVAGHGNRITVTLHKDGSLQVEDEGRGIPTGIHPEEGISAATLAVTELHAGGKFENETDDGAYKTSGGLHGVGASVVNAMSSRFEMRITQNGFLWGQDFVDGGKPVEALKQLGTKVGHGTSIRFWPDRTLFRESVENEETGEIQEIFYEFDLKIIRERLELMAYLNPGLEFLVRDEREGTADEDRDLRFCADSFASIIDLYSPQMGAPVLQPILFERTVKTPKGEVYVRVVLQPFEGEKNELISFANNIRTPGGGTHEQGFRTALLKSMNLYGNENKLLKDSLTAEDVREGMVAAILVRVREATFEGQTKDKLGNGEVSGAVMTVVYQGLNKYFEEHPKNAKDWMNRAARAQKAREAARRAREMVGVKDGLSVNTSMPAKLAPCSSKDPEKCELYLVEGDSAGGSAKQGRDSKFQAILPLKGKVLNSHRAELKDVLSSDEVRNILMVLGCGYSKTQDMAKLRYHKVVIMTDADVDGSHIATLLLTLFHNYMPDLIKNGHVYVAMPPLYRVQKGVKHDFYIKSDEELQNFFKDKDQDSWQVSRFKGLGEMNAEQLWDTTMDPATRTLGRIIYNEDGPEGANAVFDVLMGEDVPPRRAFIETNADMANVDI